MLNATVVKRTDITSDLMILHVKPDHGVTEFSPGQYVALGLAGNAGRYENAALEKEAPAADKLIKRAYSIGSSPEDKNVLEFYVAIVPDGALTSRLAAIREGDRVYAAPKITGTFTLHGTPDHHNLILVSTGTGIAPFISMIRTAATWTPGRKISLLHGVRFPSDLAYRDELLSLEETRPELFKYFPIVSRADEGSYTGLRGRVSKIFQDGLLNPDPAVDHVFLCGNPAMIDELEKDLIAKGYTEHSRKNPGNLHLERYW